MNDKSTFFYSFISALQMIEDALSLAKEDELKAELHEILRRYKASIEEAEQLKEQINELKTRGAYDEFKRLKRARTRN